GPRLPGGASRLHAGADGVLRRRRERRGAGRLGRARRRGRERARPREGRCRLDVPVGRGAGRRPGSGELPRLPRMIDLRAARTEPDKIRAALARKGAVDAFDALLEADRHWLEIVPRVDELRGRTKLKGKPTPEQLEELQAVKVQLKVAEDELDEAARERDALLERVPNPPADDSPDGFAEEDARVVREVGEPPAFPFEARDHLELSQAHGWIDTERGAKVSGTRFVYRMGQVALLELALYRWALDRIVAKGHTPMLPPVLVREEAMYGTGFFPSDKGDYYAVPEDDLYLVGTSEVPAAA